MIKKTTLFLLLLLSITFQVRAGVDEYWQPIHPALVQTTGKQYLHPNTFRTYVLSSAALRERLFSLREDPAAGIVISLPAPDGSSRDFRIWQSSIMEPALAAKYPDIKTFTAEALNNKRITAKIDFSPAGFHAMIFDGSNTYFIDPYSDVEDGNYLCYYKRDHPKTGSMTCNVREEMEAALLEGLEGTTAARTYGTQRKNYRLALACTGEYAAAVGGATPTKASVLAQMVLIMNRVNGVYQRELAVNMTLIANTDTLIFLNGATDPYTNNDGGAMLDENQTTVTNRIGTANYDIGHVFSTGGGGVAGLGVICNNSFKAWGVTGLPNPVGDPFAIDYVAHEMGHQYGSDHTFNSSLGACSGNLNNTMSFEPGSGSTIMAYAGICGTDDLQNNSDAYFHAVSLRNITNYITTGGGNTCAAVTASTNVPNTYPDFTASYSIPLWTPFELTAPSVTDATQDTLTYCWEEWDLGGFGQAWNANNNAMPYFRSFSPSTSPTRVFPVMNRILAGSYSYLGERLPTAARTLKFILTTRDIYQGWGCFNSSFDSDTVTLNVVSPGPDTFKVTSQATATTWNNGSTQTVTWTVANTTAAPINAANVNIYLSVDSGRTFPYTIASNVPNNGSASVTIPGVLPASNRARVKVKAANNVFFQVNRSNITINIVPLPVTLQSFDASLKDCAVQLSWNTSDAKGFSHFELERSEDGSVFRSVATINSHPEGRYDYTDQPAKEGTYFYRLKMQDMDGRYTYSTVINVRLACKGQHSMVVFPNPGKDKITIRSNGTAIEAAIFATNGQLVSKQKLSAGASPQMDISALSHGIYLLQVLHQDGTRNTLKLVKE